MTAYEKVQLFQLNDYGEAEGSDARQFRVEVKPSEESVIFVLTCQGQKAYEFTATSKCEFCRAGRLAIVLNLNNAAVKMKFQSEKDAENFHKLLTGVKTGAITNGRTDNTGIKSVVECGMGDASTDNDNVFDARTEQSSAVQYFQFYGYLSQQQNMMQDFIRTSTYQRAMLNNLPDFHNKVVIDVGAGSGILSFFAVQAGARKVYAIEASSIAEQCADLVRNNNLSSKITVIPGKVEEVEIPEMADVLISEPMGYMLFNERMLESYLHAKKFLRPNGKLFPTQGDLFVAPFTDECLFQEQFSKSHFWYQPNFYGVDLSSLRDTAITEYFRQPIVDTFDYQILMSMPLKHQTNFALSSENDLHNISIPLNYVANQTGHVHGLAFWFDVAFAGSKQTVWLSTAPTEPLTHWYQVRCLLKCPIFVKEGEILTGKVSLVANAKQSYDVDIALRNTSTNLESTNFLDLKNPLFRYTGQPPQPPPGSQSQTQSPTENFWGNLAQTGAGQQVSGGQAQLLSNQNGSQNILQNGLNPMTNQLNQNVVSSVYNSATQQNQGRVNSSAVSPTGAVSGVRVPATQGITTGVASMSVTSRTICQQSTAPFQTNTSGMQFDPNTFGDLLQRFPSGHTLPPQNSSQQQFIQAQGGLQGNCINQMGLAQNSH